MTAAAIESYESSRLSFADSALDCLYVVVDQRGDPAVSAFLGEWRSCCGDASVDWRAVRQPAAAIVGIELHRCCDPAAGTLRLTFEIRRDASALERLVTTEVLVVGARAYGAAGTRMVAYGLDAATVRSAAVAARQGLTRLIAAVN